jgi:hypothetical protein
MDEWLDGLINGWPDKWVNGLMEVWIILNSNLKDCNNENLFYY